MTAEKDGNGDKNKEAVTTSKSPSVEKGATAQEDDDDDVPEPVQSTERTAASSCTVSLVSEVVVPPTPGRGMTEAQKAAVLKAFNREITVGTKVSKALAQSRCCTTAVQAVLASSMTKVKQVVNHVNYIIESETRTPPPQSDRQMSPSKVTDWLQNYDDPSTRSSGKHQEWDASDTNAIETAFQKHSSMASTTDIKRIFKQDIKLYSILDREGWSRVYAKVKNIFKKKCKR